MNKSPRHSLSPESNQKRNIRTTVTMNQEGGGREKEVFSLVHWLPDHVEPVLLTHAHVGWYLYVRTLDLCFWMQISPGLRQYQPQFTWRIVALQKQYKGKHHTRRGTEKSWKHATFECSGVMHMPIYPKTNVESLKRKHGNVFFSGMVKKPKGIDSMMSPTLYSRDVRFRSRNRNCERFPTNCWRIKWNWIWHGRWATQYRKYWWAT